MVSKMRKRYQAKIQKMYYLRAKLEVTQGFESRHSDAKSPEIALNKGSLEICFL